MSGVDMAFIDLMPLIIHPMAMNGFHFHGVETSGQNGRKVLTI